MSTVVWHSGPPPSKGWWPASSVGDPTTIRWWNGSCWSLPVRAYYFPEQAAELAERPADAMVSLKVLWAARPEDWPMRSRT